MHGLTIDHATIRTVRLDETIAFYREFLGFRSGWRPPLSTGGAWLYPEGGTYPILHVIETTEDIGVGGMFDHVAFRAMGLCAYLEKLRKLSQPFVARPVPETPLTQVHHFDPNGIKLEMTFEERVADELLVCDLTRAGD